MSVRLVTLLAPLSLSLVACYGSAPPRPPKVPMPEIDPAAAIEVHTDQKTTIENVPKTAWSCPAGKAEGDPACTKTTYTEAEPVTHTTTTANIGATPLDYAQFKVITDPKWDEKLVELQDLSHKCERANVPRYAGMGLMLGGLIVGEILASQGSSAGAPILYGGVAAGGASYGIGYFWYGGRDCNTARDLYTYLNTSQEQGMMQMQGAEVASEMKALADQFNSTHAARASAEGARGGSMRMRR